MRRWDGMSVSGCTWPCSLFAAELEQKVFSAGDDLLTPASDERAVDICVLMTQLNTVEFTYGLMSEQAEDKCHWVDNTGCSRFTRDPVSLASWSISLYMWTASTPGLEHCIRSVLMQSESTNTPQPL